MKLIDGDREVEIEVTINGVPVEGELCEMEGTPGPGVQLPPGPFDSPCEPIRETSG